MPISTLRAALLALALAVPAHAATAPASVPINGAYALPDGQPKVSATLALTQAPRGGSPNAYVLDVAMTPLGGSRPITRYDVELSKRLHLIAVSGDFRTFVHEHSDAPDARGHFRVPVTYPHAGLWHVYADAVPSGLGQQVMRFDLELGGAGAGSPSRPALQPTGLDGVDGRYGVRFDALPLRAGQEAELRLRILRDGQPAPDLTPYLGVAAHAVFIAAADLTYVHAHAAPTAAPTAGGTGAAMHDDLTGKDDMDMPGMAAPPMRPGTKVPPDLTLHVRAPKAGTYLLWLQFKAGGQVRTVPFVVAVT